MQRCPNCGEIDEYPDGPHCPCHDPPRDRYAHLEPTEEDYCASGGHGYAGDDAGLGRCYCGQRLYPLGGPSRTGVEAFAAAAAWWADEAIPS